MADFDDEALLPARIPADVDRNDRILGPFTARQVAYLASLALVLYGGYWVTRTLMAPLPYLALVAPLAAVAAAFSVGRRDGIGMDRHLLAAIQFHRSPKRQVHAPEGVPDLPGLVLSSWRAQAGESPAPHTLPGRAVLEDGSVHLGADGWTASGCLLHGEFRPAYGGASSRPWPRHSPVG
ncbi:MULTISPECIES: PrgI family protein [Streptomyces]|uniref:PrgI family protein n=1 Tax=Streptomyces TaxID=1883 RepID=UPI001986CBEE|nr:MULTISPECIES: PrgI family protein [Streptomyces]GGS97444.1 hypothetical protein GCM10010286_23000 [Streptomyces toxytricini]